MLWSSVAQGLPAGCPAARLACCQHEHDQPPLLLLLAGQLLQQALQSLLQQHRGRAPAAAQAAPVGSVAGGASGGPCPQMVMRAGGWRCWASAASCRHCCRHSRHCCCRSRCCCGRPHRLHTVLGCHSRGTASCSHCWQSLHRAPTAAGGGAAVAEAPVCGAVSWTAPAAGQAAAGLERGVVKRVQHHDAEHQHCWHRGCCAARLTAQQLPQSACVQTAAGVLYLLLLLLLHAGQSPGCWCCCCLAASGCQ